jgi:NAD(P)-dependent dehydrogenase (short-subunit alcohol dehydrogenase family)
MDRTWATPAKAIEAIERFVGEGAFVYIMGRRQAELDKAVSLIGRDVVAVQGDVSNLADLDRLYGRIAAEKGKIDILFAGAGIVDPQPRAAANQAKIVAGCLWVRTRALLLPSLGLAGVSRDFASDSTGAANTGRVWSIAFRIRRSLQGRCDTGFWPWTSP